ncbi:PH domain-containing protein [Adhaeribacter terreus]|uniref:PH domain-containing protein n=1 Tax=Adhaeribacter terreus TaxID=529703 RepID=A0ABW0EGT2_9BACT
MILVIHTFREYTTIDISDWVAIGLWILFLGYYLWQWFGTYYELRNGELYYRSGFTKGSIPVSSIRKIETHTRSWANTNAALANKGMMITYHKWDELFIAPKDEAGFLEALLEINPDIQIKNPDDKTKQLASKEYDFSGRKR